MNYVLKNWKTSAAGLAMLLDSLGDILNSLSAGNGISNADLVSMVAAFGLFAAKDGNVTGAVKPVVAALGALLFSGTAMAADALPPVKAAVRQVIAPTDCTQTSCISWYLGGHFTNFGGQADLIGGGLNGIAANGLDGGADFGWEFFQNNIYLRIGILGEYDFSQTALGQPFADRWTYGVEGALGYSLAGILGGTGVTGATPPTFTGLPGLNLMLMTPYVSFGAEKRHGIDTTETGAGLENLIAPTWTLRADFKHYNYNSNVSSGLVPMNLKNESALTIGVQKHFNFKN